jgi:maltose alpha-D-glucosyltransferase/alpha-amylase
MTSPGVSLLQELLPAYLVRQRWFGAKSRTVSAVRVLEWVELPEIPAAIVFLEISYADSASSNAQSDVYQLPLALTSGPEIEGIRADAPASILASLSTANGPTILHDATAREDVRQALLALIEREQRLTASTPDPEAGASIETSSSLEKLKRDSKGETEPAPVGGEIQGHMQGRKSSAFDAARASEPLPARLGSAEQSNTSILYNGKLILKLFRRLQPGENPDSEIGRFLTEVAHFPRIAPFLGEIRGSRGGDPAPAAESTTLAMLQGLIENEGDGWQFTLDELARYYESVVTRPAPDPDDLGKPPSFLDDLPGDSGSSKVPEAAREHAGLSLEAAALLGRRTAEMHLALATPTGDPAFSAEPFTAEALAADAERIDAQISRTLDALKHALPALSDELTVDDAALILSRRLELLGSARGLGAIPPEQAGMRIRIHGDYHLGQVLRARGDYVILDFEGEPARSLAERRAKQNPLKDVAGMLRSFSYAAFSALDHFTQRHPGTEKSLQPWALLWQNAVSTEFLAAWRTTMQANPHLTPQPQQAHRLLSAYLLEKALYELLYELNNRPAWVRIPLAGILALQQ